MSTPLLNDDGTASMATLAMMSHHGLLRDIAWFTRTLPQLALDDEQKAQALRDEWISYHATLHGHHTVEDQRIFPSLRSEHPELSSVFDRLDDDHRRVDPLLSRGDEAFAKLPASRDAAIDVVSELRALLDAHLSFEEANIVRFLRAANQFPALGTEAELELYANGFAWSMHGIAPSVLEEVIKMLPVALTARFPAAIAAFEQRCERVWGTAKCGAATTSVPDDYAR